MKKDLIEQSEYFVNFSKEFEGNINFLYSFSDLIWSNGRFITFFAEDNSMHHINTSLIDSSIQTLKSIKLCCSIGNFSDANTLIRKLRDDLFLFIFILDVVIKRKTFISEDLEKLKTNNHDDFIESFSKLRYNSVFSENEKAISAWLSNNVLDQPGKIKMKLSFKNYIESLKQNELIHKILHDYHLKDYWDTLCKKLNNYVHNNGIQFTADNLVMVHNPSLEVYFKNINTRTSYIVSFFLVLIIMTDPTSISSTEAMDYFNCGEEPPEDCHYEIASFVQNYLDEKVVKIHPELKEFLRDNNFYGMKIN